MEINRLGSDSIDMVQVWTDDENCRGGRLDGVLSHTQAELKGIGRENEADLRGGAGLSEKRGGRALGQQIL